MVASRRFRPSLSVEEVQAALEPLFDLQVEIVTPAHVRRAVDRSRGASLSFWDALVVETAISSGADVLYTEDLQHGQVFGPVTVINPFAGI